MEFQLSPALYNAVSGEAADQKRSMAFIIRAALEAYLSVEAGTPQSEREA